MIKNFLKDIKIAKNHKAYLSALALALTIPDICSKIQYKEKDNRKNILSSLIPGYISMQKYQNQIYKSLMNMMNQQSSMEKYVML